MSLMLNSYYSMVSCDKGISLYHFYFIVCRLRANHHLYHNLGCSRFTALWLSRLNSVLIYSKGTVMYRNLSVYFYNPGAC